MTVDIAWPADARDASPAPLRRSPDILRTGARGLGQVLITLGIVVLLFCVYELWGTGLHTSREQDRLADQLQGSWQADSPDRTTAPARPQAPALPGEAFARLHVPSLPGVDPWVVVEGVGVRDLKKGPGHMPGTAVPGQLGNVVLSGHRTTYGAPFNRWDELDRGDQVVLETREGWFTYTMDGSQVVAPSAVEVTLPVPGRPGAAPDAALLTMTTCEPEYSAEERLIVMGRLTARTPRSAGPPAVLDR